MQRLRLRLAVAAWLSVLLVSVCLVDSMAQSRDERALARIESPPLGLPPVTIPDENHPTANKIALGRKLFFDRRLSRNGTMSCGMCHVPEQGFSNNELATPIGVSGRSLRRNAPTLLNAAYLSSMFHDGRDTSLETQVIGPLVSPKEMANPSIGYVIAKIVSLPDYEGLFEASFAGAPTIDRLGQAIASWERSLVSGDSPFDRWRYGRRDDALTLAQKRGLELFVGEAGCASCHLVGDDYALFTDHSFHDTGVGYQANLARQQRGGTILVEIAPGVSTKIDRTVAMSVGELREADLGRYEVTLDPQDRWRFKTLSLRNIALTGPYMHDGSLDSLEAVVRFYNRGGVLHGGLDSLLRPLGLTDDEVRALVTFLRALTASNIGELTEDARSAPIGN